MGTITIPTYAIRLYVLKYISRRVIVLRGQEKLLDELSPRHMRCRVPSATRGLGPVRATENLANSVEVK